MGIEQSWRSVVYHEVHIRRLLIGESIEDGACYVPLNYQVYVSTAHRNPCARSEHQPCRCSWFGSFPPMSTSRSSPTQTSVLLYHSLVINRSLYLGKSRLLVLVMALIILDKILTLAFPPQATKSEQICLHWHLLRTTSAFTLPLARQMRLYTRLKKHICV